MLNYIRVHKQCFLATGWKSFLCAPLLPISLSFIIHLIQGWEESWKSWQEQPQHGQLWSNQQWWAEGGQKSNWDMIEMMLSGGWDNNVPKTVLKEEHHEGGTDYGPCQTAPIRLRICHYTTIYKTSKLAKSIWEQELFEGNWSASTFDQAYFLRWMAENKGWTL